MTAKTIRTIPASGPRVPRRLRVSASSPAGKSTTLPGMYATESTVVRAMSSQSYGVAASKAIGAHAVTSYHGRL
jgi:hypothetical protein